MNGKLNMRQNIKEQPEFKTSNLDESIISEETVTQGITVMLKKYCKSVLQREMNLQTNFTALETVFLM